MAFYDAIRGTWDMANINLSEKDKPKPIQPAPMQQAVNNNAVKSFSLGFSPELAGGIKSLLPGDTPDPKAVQQLSVEKQTQQPGGLIVSNKLNPFPHGDKPVQYSTPPASTKAIEPTGGLQSPPPAQTQTQPPQQATQSGASSVYESPQKVTKADILNDPKKLQAVNDALATQNDPNASQFDKSRASNIMFTYGDALRNPEGGQAKAVGGKEYGVNLGDKNGGTIGTGSDKAAAERINAGIAARGGLSSPPPTQSAAAQAAGTTDFWINNGLPGGAAQFKAEQQQAAQQQQLAQIGKLALQGNKEAIAVMQGLGGFYQGQNQQGLQRDAMTNEMTKANVENNKPANQLANQVATMTTLASQGDPNAKEWMKQYAALTSTEPSGKDRFMPLTKKITRINPTTNESETTSEELPFDTRNQQVINVNNQPAQQYSKSDQKVIAWAQETAANKNASPEDQAKAAEVLKRINGAA